jgi:hypothetical protein
VHITSLMELVNTASLHITSLTELVNTASLFTLRLSI